MKYNLTLVLAIFIAMAFWGCKGGGFGSSAKEENFDRDASYALGMSIGANLAQDGIVPNMNEFLRGMKDNISGGKTRFDQNEAMEIIQSAYYAMMEKREADAAAKGVEELEKGNEFLVENSKKTGVITTSSGLQYEVITQTSGPKPSSSDFVQVHYEGRLIDGTVFDSSYQRGTPAEFPLNGVIAGWTEGVQLMSVGSKYKFYIPSELGYGSRGGGPIPPNSVLMFEVELIYIL
jgi:FKBP-type peptidyl-prolyl cis-trans isomerase